MQAGQCSRSCKSLSNSVTHRALPPDTVGYREVGTRATHWLYHVASPGLLHTVCSGPWHHQDAWAVSPSRRDPSPIAPSRFKTASGVSAHTSTLLSPQFQGSVSAPRGGNLHAGADPSQPGGRLSCSTVTTKCLPQMTQRDHSSGLPGPSTGPCCHPATIKEPSTRPQHL